MKNFNAVLDSQGKIYKHVFFDVDKTLTRSRTLIEPQMKAALFKLCATKDVVVVSGAQIEQIWKQVGVDFSGKVFVLAQNGNYAVAKDRKDLWRNNLSEGEKREMMEHIGLIRRQFKELFVDVDEHDLVQDRGCQITFSLVGHNAELTRKERFDPKVELRTSILEKIPFSSKTLEVKIGGTTSFDYFRRGKNKGYNISQLMKFYGWKTEDSIYIGDALFSGGNDDSVIGVCDTLQVSGPEETLAAISKMIS
ncbi:MAG: HAD-IIB family hydrolase [Candidatus Taylorbacteria bacterium]|nr:HAD-IIB family hydrolase [Candidatus Taylorbacteria bacterium]